MMFSGNGYTQKPLSWEKRKVWGNKKIKEKVAPQRDFGGSEGHKSTDKAHFDKRQDMWIFWTAFFPAGRQRIPKRKQITITRKSY